MFSELGFLLTQVTAHVIASASPSPSPVKVTNFADIPTDPTLLKWTIVAARAAIAAAIISLAAVIVGSIELYVATRALVRRPRLFLRFPDGKTEVWVSQRLVRPQPMPMNLCVCNGGSKTADSPLLRLLIPPGVTVTVRIPRHQFPGTISTTRESGQDYTQIDCPLDRPSYPKFEILMESLQIEAVHAVDKTLAILWRLACDDGTFPEDEAWGALAVHVQA